MEELTAEEVDTVLERIGYGFLGLARNGRPYVVPMSFGYDGTSLFFQMNDRGRKFDYIESGSFASFTTLSVDGETGISRSVVVDGTLHKVPDEDTRHALETLATNANFGTDLSIWGVPLEEAEPTLYVLRPDEKSGRSFGEDMR